MRLKPWVPFVTIIAIVGLVMSSTGKPLGSADLPQAIAAVTARYPDVTHCDPSTLRERMTSGHVLIDVRPLSEWRVSHLPQAQRLDGLDDLVALTKRQPGAVLILYCSIGERSSRLARALRLQVPSAQVMNLTGGIFSWATTDGPMISDTGIPTRLVHPYDSYWGGLLPTDRRADTGSGGP